MPALSAPNAAKWRTSHTYLGYLYIDHPEIVFAAQVNESAFTWPLTSVEFDGVTTGAYTAVLPGLTVLFGSTPGGDDYGRQRIRKAADSNTIFVGESSQGTHDGELDLVDDCYITVLNERRIWAVEPYIDPTTKVYYKDYEIPFVDGGRNYGSRPGPMAVGGCDKCAIVDPDTSVATFDFESGSSWPFSSGSSISSVAWDVIDGTITVGTASTDNITATFPKGRRYVTLTVTDSNGDTHTHYILTVALDPTDNDWTPIYDFEIKERRLTVDSPILTVVVHQALDLTVYPEGTSVFYIEDEAYAGTHGSLAGPATCTQIKFRGWLNNEAMNPQATPQGVTTGVELRCVSTVERMRRINLLPQRLEDNGSPAKWWEFDGVSHYGFLFYLLRWHSTVLDVAPVTFATSADVYLSAAKTTAASLWQQVEEFARACGKRVTCDQRGVLRWTDYPLLQDIPDRTATVIVALTADDYSEASIERDRPPEIYWVDGKGITFDNQPMFCIAPGLAPGQGATRIEFSGQYVADQINLNMKTGHEYARINSPWSPIRLKMIHTGDAGIEPALMEWVTLTLPSTTNERGYAFTNQRCLPVEVITRQPADGKNIKETELLLFVETVGVPAATVIPETGADVPAYNPPSTYYPVTNYYPSGGESALRLYKGTRKISAFNSDGYLYRTTDFGARNPVWTRYDLGLTADGFGNKLYDFVVDPFSPLYLNVGTTVNGWIAAAAGIYRIDDIFGSHTLTLQHTFAQDLFAAGGTVEWRVIESSFGFQNWVMCASMYNTGGDQGTFVTYTTDGSTWAAEQQVGIDDDVYGWGTTPGLYVSSKTAGLSYVLGRYAVNSGGVCPTKGYVSTDYGANWAAITPGTDGPNLVGSQWGALVVPWHNNASEKLAYWGYLRGPDGAFVDRTYRTESDGTTVTEITPVVSGANYRPRGSGKWSIFACPEDRLAVAMAGFSSPTAVSALFTSMNGGNSWMVLPGSTGSGIMWFGVCIAGNARDVLYAWGASGRIGYSQDFAAGYEDKRGNITTWTPGTFVAIAGG